MILNMPVCNENITFVLTREGLTAFVERIGVVLTDFVHQGTEFYMRNSSTNIKTIDMEAFSIEFGIDGIGQPDYIVSDNEGIFLSMKIQEVRFKLAVDGNLGEMMSGKFRFSRALSYDKCDTSDNSLANGVGHPFFQYHAHLKRCIIVWFDPSIK